MALACALLLMAAPAAVQEGLTVRANSTALDFPNTRAFHLEASAPVLTLGERARTERNIPARIEFYRQAERVLLADAAIVPLFHAWDYMLVRPK